MYKGFVHHERTGNIRYYWSDLGGEQAGIRTHPRTRLLTSHAFQQKMASARGRPRGKGRGIPQQPAESGKQHQAQRAHKTPKDEAGLNVYLESLNEGNLASFGSMFTNMVIDYSSSDRRLQEAVDLIFTKTTKDRENASFGAKICSLKPATPNSGTSSIRQLTREDDWREMAFVLNSLTISFT